MIRNNVAVARGYRIGHVRCRVLFCPATRMARPLEQKLAAWQPFIRQPIEVVEMDCPHRYLLVPQPLSVIGPAVTERLARAAVLS